jgi:hypothetical protein
MWGMSNDTEMASRSLAVPQAQAERPAGRHSAPHAPSVGPDGKRQPTVAEIAEAVGVHRTTVYDYLKKER